MATSTLLDLRCNCQRCVERTRETYRLHWQCTNCGKDGEAKLRKGDKPGYSADCPNCGVSGLKFGPSAGG